MAAVGIDLGTTYTCVSVLQDNKIIAIPVCGTGKPTMSSCVAFTNLERLIGDAARQQMTRNPTNTVFDVKRIMGLSYDNAALKTDMRRWPFKINNCDGDPKIEVEYKGELKEFRPEEISAMILEKAKESAETYLKQEVVSAVVTVPAYFNDAQRRATRDAIKITGLKLLHMINEPTAAAIAYGYKRKMEGNRNILVFDLGGGTFDVTVLTARPDAIIVHSTAGDTHLGGEDFNDRMLQYFLVEIKEEFGVDLTERAKCRLMVELEDAKKILSTALETTISLDALFDSKDFHRDISRALFEDKNLHLFEQTLGTVERALLDAGMNKEQIDEVVLVGGSTHIPKIQDMLKNYFGEEKICKTIHPDESVSYGAAVHASMLAGLAPDEMIKDVNDITPLALGVRCKGGVMETVVERNARIPFNRSRTFTTSFNDQTVLDLQIFEGQRAMAAKNHRLEGFQLRGIKAKPAGKPKIVVSFDIDKNGVLEVSASDVDTGRKNQIKIAYDSGHLSDEKIQEMIKEAERFREADAQWRRRTVAMNDLEAESYRIQRSAQNLCEKFEIPKEDKNDVLSKCWEARQWRRLNKDPDMEEIATKRGELTKIYNRVFARYKNSE